MRGRGVGGERRKRGIERVKREEEKDDRPVDNQPLRNSLSSKGVEESSLLFFFLLLMG